MGVARYHKCPECTKYISYIQKRCDCGRAFTGKEYVYKVCPACANLLEDDRLRCDCGYLFIFRRFLDKQGAQASAQDQIDAAYEAGKRDGAAEEKAKNDAEWDHFFVTAKLKNTVSGGPILSREDFYKWSEEFAAAKAGRKQRAKEEATRTEAKTFPRAHYTYAWKEDIAYEVILQFAVKLEDAVSDSLKESIKDLGFYISVGALCAWAELVLSESREVTHFVVSDVSTKNSSDVDEKATYLERVMLSSADAVGLSIEGKEHSEIFVSASHAIQKLLFLKEDVETMLIISTVLVEFSREYLTQKQTGI